MLSYFDCYLSLFWEVGALVRDFYMDFSFYTEKIKTLELLGNPSRLSIVCKLIVWGSLSVSEKSKLTQISEDMILQHVRKLVLGNIVKNERKVAIPLYGLNNHLLRKKSSIT